MPLLSRLRFRARPPLLAPAGLELRGGLLHRMWAALAQPSPASVTIRIVMGAVRTVVITEAESQRAVLIDSLICGLFPALYVPTHHPALSLRRAAFASLLTAHPALTPARYLRLSALALIALLLTAPLATFTIALNLGTASPPTPCVSFADTHFDLSAWGGIPHFVWAADGSSRIAMELTRWASPVCGLIFFAFFGFAVEARRHYAMFFGVVATAFWRCAARLGIHRPALGFLAAASPKGSFGFASSKGLGDPSAKATGGLS
ncbi:pheromone A receptor-domain-containing protein [Mycena vulgaris]|nr:pheromone A receptor-domain-containing protein [Mycena vulgaris]